MMICPCRRRRQGARNVSADGVYSVMLDRLISNGIKPGARITVDGLSRELEVSQTPVREALTRLESDGLVVKVHLCRLSSDDSAQRGSNSSRT